MSCDTYACESCGSAIPEVCGVPLEAICRGCGLPVADVTRDLRKTGHGGDQAKVEKPAESEKKSIEAKVDLGGGLFARIEKAGAQDVVEADAEHDADYDADYLGPAASAPDDEDERPIHTYIQAARATKKYVRALKREYPEVYRKLVRKPCSSCRLPCLLAASTEAERVKLESEGLRAEVICSKCYPQVMGEKLGGVTEGQSKELSQALVRKAGREGLN